MNELERLIAAIVRPEPSDKLDESVQALFAQVPVRQPVFRWKMAMAWCATAACVGIVGFFLGRQSAITQPASAPVTTAASSDPPAGKPPAPFYVMNIPLRNDQLAGLFIRPPVREGMLGKGPVRIEVSTSP